jgi:hypothetical protein
MQPSHYLFQHSVLTIAHRLLYLDAHMPWRSAMQFWNCRVVPMKDEYYVCYITLNIICHKIEHVSMDL